MSTVLGVYGKFPHKVRGYCKEEKMKISSTSKSA